jgi:hypothetical protein
MAAQAMEFLTPRKRPLGTAGPVERAGGVAYFTRILILMIKTSMMIGSHP